jgi:hypothetical protein
MKTISVAALLTLALLLGGATAQAGSADRLRVGKYDITIDGAAVGSHCYLPEDVEKINGSAQDLRKWLETRDQSADGASCSVKDFNVVAGKISMTVVCSDHTTTGVLTYRGDSFETVETVTKGKEVTTSKVAGHRTGDCSK